MHLSAWARSPGPLSPSGPDLLRLAVILSFPVTALGQFLHTPPREYTVQPLLQVEHWVSGSLMTLPLFAAGVCAGDWLASRAGAGMAKYSDVAKRALATVLLVALALTPLWFERNKVDGQVQAQALVTPRSHGSVDVYWAGSGVIVALVCVCLIPAAVWAGRGIAGRLPAGLPDRVGAMARASLPVLLAAAVPALAWLLHQAATHAYASQVDNTSALLHVHVLSHAFFGGSRPPVTAGAAVTAAPYALAYQLAHALQDGLAGQAAGLPVAVLALLWGTRPRSPGQYHQADTAQADTQQEVRT